MKKWQLITDQCCEINKRISVENKYDGVASMFPFTCDGSRLYGIADKDKHLLNEEEQAQLIPYEEPKLENL